MAERSIWEQAYGRLASPDFAAPSQAVQSVRNPGPMVGRGNLSSYDFSWRDMTRQWLKSLGLSDSMVNNTMTLAEFTPAGAAFAGNDARRSYNRGERVAPAAEVALAALPLPAAVKKGAAKVVPIVERESENLFRILVDGKRVGTVGTARGGAFVSSADIDFEFQNKGIAASAYDQIEAMIGKKLVPSPLGLTAQATRFWQKRLDAMSPSAKNAAISEAMAIGKSYGVPEEDLVSRLAPLAKTRQVAREVAEEAPTVTVY